MTSCFQSRVRKAEAQSVTRRAAPVTNGPWTHQSSCSWTGKIMQSRWRWLGVYRRPSGLTHGTGARDCYVSLTCPPASRDTEHPVMMTVRLFIGFNSEKSKDVYCLKRGALWEGLQWADVRATPGGRSAAVCTQHSYLYVYMHTHMYTYMYIHICTYISTYSFMYSWVMMR